jgi:iron complex outermembrane receptor protein
LPRRRAHPHVEQRRAQHRLSSQSYGRAATLDPLLIERLEVLRGPAALQYGGNAVGGVVNVIDNRIPRKS